MCPPAVTPVATVTVEESLADCATDVVATVNAAVPESVVSLDDAAIEPCAAATVPLFVPLPNATLSLKSGTLNVVEPSPVP